MTNLRYYLLHCDDDRSPHCIIPSHFIEPYPNLVNMADILIQMRLTGGPLLYPNCWLYLNTLNLVYNATQHHAYSARSSARECFFPPPDIY